MLTAGIRRFAFAVLLFFAGPVFAGQPDEEPPPYEPRSFVSQASVQIGGARVRYRAIAEDMGITDADGEPVASVFSFTYLRQGVGDASRRPVVFAFNGGPGSASIWLHMGLLGPKRVVVPSDAQDDGADVRIEANPYSPLDVADIVLIDPVGTGYSRGVEGHEDREFWGMVQDAGLLAQFVRQWLTKYRRWDSPKYLLGESYGSTRAALMVRALGEEEFGSVALNGVILMSAALDFQGIRPMPHNADVSVTYLPSYTATAWRHGLIPDARDLTTLLQQARAFAIDEYGPALERGQRLSAEERARVRRRLSYFSGLSEAYLDTVDLHIHPQRYAAELLRARGLTIGRLDSRYAGRDFDAASEITEGDPSNYGFGAAYAQAGLQYIAEDLGVDMRGLHYVVSNRSGIKPLWDWRMPDPDRWARGMNPQWPSHVNVAPYLGDEMRRNSDFRVLLVSGYYDLATPFFGPENSMYQTGMLPDRVTFKYYEAGHMMYVHQPSLVALSADLRAFINAGAR